MGEITPSLNYTNGKKIVFDGSWIKVHKTSQTSKNESTVDGVNFKNPKYTL